MKRAIFAIGSLLLCLSTNANDFYFKTRTSNGEWATTGNWTVNNVNATTLPEANDKIKITTTNHPVMINNLHKTIRWQLIYLPDAPSTTINGTAENTFKGDNQSIENTSRNVQTINFPIKVGEVERRNITVGIKSGAGIVFNSTIKLNGNILHFEGGSTTRINSTIIGGRGRVEVKNGGIFDLGNNAHITDADLFVQGSTLKFEGRSNLDRATNLLLENSALIDLNAAGVDVQSITENQNPSTLDVDRGVLSICGNQNSKLESTLVKGTGTIINKGGGILTLANTSDNNGKFTGAIEVQSGKVVVTNDNVDLRKIVVASGASFESKVSVTVDTLSIPAGARISLDYGKTITVKGVVKVEEGAIVTGGGKILLQGVKVITTRLPLGVDHVVASNLNVEVEAGKILRVVDNQDINSLLIKCDDVLGQGELQIEGGTLHVNSVAVEQRLSAARNYYLSNPFGNALPSGATYYRYNESAAGNTVSNHWETTTQSSKGVGFIARTTGPTTLTFRGNLPANDVNVHLTASGQVKKGFNLVGNPYLRDMNVSTLLRGNSNMEHSVWYRTRNSRSYVFHTVNVTSGVATGGATVTVAPLQSFWVRTSNRGGCNLTFKTNMLNSAGNNNHGGGRLFANAVPNKLIRLTVSEEGVTDETVLYANPEATYDVDDYDSHKMSNDNVNVPEIYTVAAGEQLVINGVPSLKMNQEIPLGFKTAKAGDKFSIKASELENLDENVRVILKDGSVETDITDGAEYTFQSDKYDGTDRFSIILRSPEVATGIKNAGNNDVVALVDADGTILVKADTKDEAVTVYNAAGQLVASQQLVDGRASVRSIHTAGVYWVKVEGDGSIATKKVIVK